MKVGVKKETRQNCLSLIILEIAVRPASFACWVGILNLCYLTINIGLEGSLAFLFFRNRIIRDRILCKTRVQKNGRQLIHSEFIDVN